MQARSFTRGIRGAVVGRVRAIRRAAVAAVATVGAAGAALAESPLRLTDVSDRLAPFARESFTRGGDALAGAAWLDFDRDGDLDLFLTNGPGLPNALFRNDGSGGFEDVAALAGVDDRLGGSGVVAGDIDDDGYPDLFVMGEGHCRAVQSPMRLYHNQGDGSFSEIAAEAGVGEAFPAWSAAFGDIDGDRDLDLFVAGAGNLCRGVTNPNKLYRNNGDLTFSEISAAAGVDTDIGACAAGFLDVDRDGLQDLWVSNCNGFSAPFTFLETPFELYRNNGDGTFTDIAPNAGLGGGLLGFWMTATFGDIDNDGDEDFFATSLGPANVSSFDYGPAILLDWPHALLRNNGDGTFDDVAAERGVADFEFGWGASLADLDNDGDLDLFATGSLVGFGPGEGFANPGRLFVNDGTGHFRDRSDLVPVDLSFSFTSGVAQADMDDNGTPDLVVVRDLFGAGPGEPVLLRAEPNANHWLSVRLEGVESNRAGIGARVEVQAGLRQMREVRAGSSFASSESPWPHFGLGRHRRAQVRVHWPSGRSDFFPSLAVDRTVTLVEGTGLPGRGWARDVVDGG